MFGQRTFIATGAGAEGDKTYGMFIYNDASGSLSVGMPLYVDVTDAAEFNNRYPSSALSGPVAASGGKVVLGTNANATNARCVGVFAPENPGWLPNKGDAIRVLVKGRGLVSAAAKSGGTAVEVGDILITDTSQTSLLSGHDTYTVGKVVAIALATSSATAATNTIISAPGSGTTTQVINGWVDLA